MKKNILFYAIISFISFTSNAQQIKFTSKECNFGAINKGDTVICEFNFVNDSKKQMSIQSVKVSCECINVDYFMSPYAPGENGKITFTLISSDLHGTQFYAPIITSNSIEKSIEVLYINGTVSDLSGSKKINITTSVPVAANTNRQASIKDSLYSFWGIPFGSSKDVVLNKMRDHGALMTEKTQGKITILSSNNEVDFSNKSIFLMSLKLVDDHFYQADLLFKTASPHIQNDFDNMAEDLSRKYFKAETFANYKSPYEKGDGHEESSISMGYGELSAYWMFQNQKSISLRTFNVGREIYVKLCYQDGSKVDEAIEEKTKTSDY